MTRDELLSCIAMGLSIFSLIVTAWNEWMDRKLSKQIEKLERRLRANGQ
jgi:hypothetical protein